jgi:hypothetical protein
MKPGILNQYENEKNLKLIFRREIGSKNLK